MLTLHFILKIDRILNLYSNAYLLQSLFCMAKTAELDDTVYSTTIISDSKALKY